MSEQAPDTNTPLPSQQLAEVVLDHATLFHGSATPGITEFERAEEDTVGAGVYLANEATARGYALHRSRRSGTAVLYEVEVEDARLVDLTEQDTVAEVMTGFRHVLQREHQQQTRDGGPWYWTGALRQMIDEIDSGRGVQVGAVKLVTQRSGELFTGYLEGRGFDGVVALEGGEGELGGHHSYLLFDPAKLRIRSEQHVEPAEQPTTALTTIKGRTGAERQGVDAQLAAAMACRAHPTVAALEQDPVHVRSARRYSSLGMGRGHGMETER